MEYEIICSKCGKKIQDLLSYKCGCGQPLKVHLLQSFDSEKIRRKDYTVWRYSSFFPYVKEKAKVTLGEGWTPLVKFSKTPILNLKV